MLNHDKTGLQIFDNFHIDYNLQKWQKRREDSSTPEGTSSRFTTFGRSSNSLNIEPSGIFIPSNDGALLISGTDSVPTSASVPKKEGFFDKLFGRARKRRLLEEDRIKAEMEKPNFTIIEPDKSKEVKEMSAKEFFESVKNSAEELKLVNERFQSYEKALAHLKKTGQIAMRERMEHELEIHRAETQLYAMGFTKVVTEENIIKFAKSSCRDLRLDWIKNFVRLIPEKVLEAKEKIDDNLIFDNYVILHYDPYRNGVLKTLAEIEKEKDPILFGVIAGSNKLYYVADWIDEYCDLTFDKLVEKLGAEAINANDITAEIKVSKF